MNYLKNLLPENNEAQEPEIPFSIKLNCSTSDLPGEFGKEVVLK